MLFRIFGERNSESGFTNIVEDTEEVVEIWSLGLVKTKAILSISLTAQKGSAAR